MLEVGLSTQDGQLRLRSGGLRLVTENNAFIMICFLCSVNAIQSRFKSLIIDAKKTLDSWRDLAKMLL